MSGRGLVLDDGGNAVTNASVSDSWSAGASGSGSCTTDGSGQCPITKNNIHKNSSSATFTVTAVSHAGKTYDPDGNNATSILITKPDA